MQDGLASGILNEKKKTKKHHAILEGVLDQRDRLLGLMRTNTGE